MGYIADLIGTALPGTFVHSVQLGSTEDQDKNAGFFGILMNQVAETCEKLKAVPELQNGFNGIGFSQGGLFLRAYVETCSDGPKVHNLITYGSPHMGVGDAPNCQDKSDTNCSIMRSLIKSGAYLSWVQNRVVQAQYFKDPKNYETYLEKSLFLPFINNEVTDTKREEYKANLKALNKLVLIRFSEDTMVIPSETSWFGFFDEELNVVPMEQQPLYIEDWIGLRWLDENGRVDKILQEGGHMKIDEDMFVNQIIPTYLANLVSSDSGRLLLQD
ncbi:alpha/beta-hydrolase [Rhizoclosmatium globosum]|uniref:Palmitoyl-protein thioesterase 1 n=1 Tax=Rhizoclosmatium globosum TaxID=329046 RepID=A0A1Y2D3E4_9FUNG|nr:alpha/beta-hydrolase [Rhizoclosmatium globosum]|eukprot:ORY53802.1 alpha/beta-hydrolase [Rhizoclosmatium globosum]